MFFVHPILFVSNKILLFFPSISDNKATNRSTRLNTRVDEWSLRAFASMLSTAILLRARAEIKNLLCELARNAKIWGARASEHLFKFLRANRAKVKFCEQLKILMDHSSPLLVLPTSPDTRYPVGNRWNYLSHKGAVILLLTILSSSAFIASFFGTGTLHGGWTTGSPSLSSWIQYSPGRQPTPSQQRD